MTGEGRKTLRYKWYADENEVWAEVKTDGSSTEHLNQDESGDYL